jgi:hypothetical protein
MVALWYFGVLITIWTIVGHAALGFEQSYAQPIAGVSSAVVTTFVLEWLRAWSAREKPRFIGGFSSLASLVLPAWISGLAVSFLLYPNEKLGPILFAAAVSICSKAIIRVRIYGGTQHIFNPSNFGVVLTLFLFPWVGLAPPYHFTENLTGVAHWLVPAGILVSGILVHFLCTGRLPLCLAWLAGFVAQASARSFMFGIPWIVPLMPMTSAAFVLFTLYMLPDPATTPLDRKQQICFGLVVAACYGVLLSLHIVFGLFVSLFLICLLRGGALFLQRYRTSVEGAPALDTAHPRKIAAGS